MAPVRWASSEGSGGEKSKVGTLDMGVGSTGFFNGVESVGPLLSWGGPPLTCLPKESGGTGGFWDRHLTDCTRIRRGIDLVRIENILQTVGSSSKFLVKFILVYFQQSISDTPVTNNKLALTLNVNSPRLPVGACKYGSNGAFDISPLVVQMQASESGSKSRVHGKSIWLYAIPWAMILSPLASNSGYSFWGEKDFAGCLRYDQVNWKTSLRLCRDSGLLRPLKMPIWLETPNKMFGGLTTALMWHGGVQLVTSPSSFIKYGFECRAGSMYFLLTAWFNILNARLPWAECCGPILYCIPRPPVYFQLFDLCKTIEGLFLSVLTRRTAIKWVHRTRAYKFCRRWQRSPSKPKRYWCRWVSRYLHLQR